MINIKSYTDIVRACPKPDPKPRKEKKPIEKVSKKQRDKMLTNKQYYKLAIAKNILKNKNVCRCDECGNEIKVPTGRNVCHILSEGNNQALYTDPENHFILGKGSIFNECNCGPQYDEIDPTVMSIYPESEKRKQQLNLKYYTGE